jgi:hypothetical protein
MTPLGLAPWSQISSGYPNPLTFPQVWIWTTPTISSSISIVSGQVEGWNDQTSAQRNLGGDPDTGAGGYIETGVFINGIPAINMSGTSEGCMATAGINNGIFNFQNLQYFTVFCVFQPEISINPVDQYSRILDTEFTNGFTLCINATGTHYKLIVADGSSPYGTVEAGTPTVGVPVLLTGIYNNGNATLQINGVTGATGTFTNPSSNASIDLSVCQLSGSGGEGQPGYYGDICLCVGPSNGSSPPNPQPTAALSGTTLLNANRFFGKKYNIVVP